MTVDRDQPYHGLFGTPQPSSTNEFLDNLLKALESAGPTPVSRRADLDALLNPQPAAPQPNALGSIFASQPRVASVPVAQTPKQRSTFYSFHYDDVFRVNHIRNAGVLLRNDRERFRTPQDKSLWEKAKNTNPNALKIMIMRAMAGTTVTAVLAGERTWERQWVRFEIARSLLKRNGLLTVHMDGCECPNNGFGQRGPNPLSFLALGRNQRIYELDASGDWVLYDKISQPLQTWPKWLARPKPGYVTPLDTGAMEYDWINDNGRENLLHWTHSAARAAGR